MKNVKKVKLAFESDFHSSKIATLTIDHTAERQELTAAQAAKLACSSYCCCGGLTPVSDDTAHRYLDDEIDRFGRITRILVQEFR